MSPVLRALRALVAVVLVLVFGVAPALAYKRSYIALPEILTDPNEGNTYGFLAVVLFLDDNKIIKYILAPDVRYNKLTGVFPAFRLFGYPNPDTKWSVVLRKSTEIDENYDFRYENQNLLDGQLRVFGNFEFERDSTERFYGFGNGSSEKFESNYTAKETTALGWVGYRVQPALEFTYQARMRVFRVEKGSIDTCPARAPGGPDLCDDDELPFIRRQHPGTPGLAGDTALGHEFGVLYDTRDDTNIPRRGGFGLLSVEFIPELLVSSFNAIRYAAEGRQFLPFRDRFVLALHGRIDYLQGDRDEIPFFEQSDLGGRRSLRGFGSGRFVDKNRVFGSVELRTRVYRREIFGVNAELEVAPFIDVGQVFRSSRDSPVDDLHAVGGLGFRGVVPPQVVGFVDVGVGEQGAAAFTGLEYPF